jgi:hypothetical protein
VTSLEQDTTHPQLGPGRHPTAGRYSYVYSGRSVHADAEHVGDIFAGGLRTWDDPHVAMTLALAHDNTDIGPEARALLPWALTTVSAQTPSALGLVGQAAYSGPGATSLVGNLGHRRRGAAFAAELIVAACLVYRGWPAADTEAQVGDARDADLRLDFGVKLAGDATARRTAEADILLTAAGGSRVAVDVKTSRVGVYRHAPSPAMLEVIHQALQRREIDSFHFVSPGRFRPAFRAAVAAADRIHVHEHVWPSPADRLSIRRQERAAIDYRRALGAARVDGQVDFALLADSLGRHAADAYRRTTAGDRSIVEVPLRFTYLFDETNSPDPSQACARLIAGWGTAGAEPLPRDRRFMRGFPMPRANSQRDRGHLVAREAGGDEGLGINLFPQDRELNQGRGADGRRWRAIERFVAEHLGGVDLFVRAVYDDDSDTPVALEYLTISGEGEASFQRFRNRPHAP